MDQRKIRVLHVDGNMIIRNLIQREFEFEFPEAKLFSCRSIEEAREIRGKESIDVILMDLMLGEQPTQGDKDDLEAFLEENLEIGVPVVILSAAEYRGGSKLVFGLDFFKKGSTEAYVPNIIKVLREKVENSKRKVAVIVEDDKGVRNSVSELLTDEFGFKVRAFEHSNDALDYLETNKADLIITDVLINGQIVDPGVEIILKEGIKRGIPTIVFSFADYDQMPKVEGVEILFKPCMRLREEIEKILEKQEKVVVIVDDDPEYRKTFAEYFAREGVKIVGFPNPEKALAFIKQNRVDVLITDIKFDLCVNANQQVQELLRIGIERGIPTATLSGADYDFTPKIEGVTIMTKSHEDEIIERLLKKAGKFRKRGLTNKDLKEIKRIANPDRHVEDLERKMIAEMRSRITARQRKKEIRLQLELLRLESMIKIRKERGIERGEVYRNSTALDYLVRGYLKVEKELKRLRTPPKKSKANRLPKKVLSE